jgi:transcriptional regulator with XRE-family HTH domain
MNRAKQLRIDAGLSTLELANKADVSRATIDRLEAGDNVTAGRLFKIARTLSDLHGGVTVRPSELQLAAYPEQAA